jgi:hypothetical protein
MSWMCIRCSERHLDGMGTMGFGLCKLCHEKMKAKNAEERAAALAAKRKKSAKK